MLLEALVACAGVTLKAVATALRIRLNDARLTAEGDLDFRGTLGVAKDAAVGFRNIRLKFELDAERPRSSCASCWSSPSATASCCKRSAARRR